MPEKPSTNKISLDWFEAIKSTVLVVVGVLVLWLNSNYASIVDLQVLDERVVEVESKNKMLDQKIQSIVELINTKLEYIKRDTDEIKKELKSK
jgi:predicted nucleic acid-binding protein